MPSNYDGNYPQYQFAQGGLMQALSPEQSAYDPKFLQDSLLQKLFQEQTKQQILNAFTPGQGGSGGAPSGGNAPGGLSFLEQLLASTTAPTTPVPAAPPAPSPAPAPAPVDPRAGMVNMGGWWTMPKNKVPYDGGGGMVDRGGYGGLGMAGY